jgi:ribosomal protein L29
MPILRNKDMSKMSNSERDSKIKDLKMELVKEQVNLAKGGKTKVREMKKTIARLMTFNRLNQSVDKK